MNELVFATAQEFQSWLEKHGETSEGAWLLFEKGKNIHTLTAKEALEEALCYGWVEGQLRKLDEKRYLKYFAPRRTYSNWSEKNQKLAKKLMEQGRMTPIGKACIEDSIRFGTWETSQIHILEDRQMDLLLEILEGMEPARSNYRDMSTSVKKAYASYYFSAKTEAVRKRRLEKIRERLTQNL